MFHHFLWLQDPGGTVYRSESPCYGMSGSEYRALEKAGFKILRRQPSNMYWYHTHSLKPKVQFVPVIWSLIAGVHVQRGAFYFMEEFKNSQFFVHPGRPYYPIQEQGYHWHVNINNIIVNQWLPQIKKL